MLNTVVLFVSLQASSGSGLHVNVSITCFMDDMLMMDMFYL